MSDNSQPEGRNALSGYSYDRFYRAKFDRWVTRAYWLPHEVAALSMGYDPRSLNLKALSEKKADPEVALEFLDRIDVVRRAIEVEQLDVQSTPRAAFDWLTYHGIPFPEELKKFVERKTGRICWKQAFFVLSEDVMESTSEITGVLEKWSELDLVDRSSSVVEFGQLRKVAGFLDQALEEQYASEQKLIELQKQVEISTPKPTAANDNLNGTETPTTDPRRMTSLYKIIVGLAIECERFDPFEDKDEHRVAKEIESKLSLLGLALNQKTITTALYQAKVHLCEKGLLQNWKQL